MAYAVHSEFINRPAVVIGFEGDAGKGSGRSVAGVDLGAAVHRLSAEGLIDKGGGHRMAAGLSLSRAQLEPAMARLADLMARQGAGTTGPRDLRLDGLLMAAGATAELVAALDGAGPFGAGAPAPRFALPDMVVRDARRVGDSHLKLTLAQAGQSLDAIAFGAFDGSMGAALEARRGGIVHAAGRLELNQWGGRTHVQLRLDDAALP